MTPYVARVVGRMSEGTRIHISNTTKHLLDKIGGFRCEYRGILELGVSLNTHILSKLHPFTFLNNVPILDIIFYNDIVDLIYRQETISWRRFGYMEETKTLPERFLGPCFGPDQSISKIVID